MPMLTKLRDNDLLWPGAFALAALAFLLGLGTWQIQRKTWKDDLVAQIRQRTTAAPVALPTGAADLPEYTRIRALGRFDHGAERHVYSPATEGSGWLIFTPMLVENADGPVPVMVNRGWVPEHLKAPADRPQGQIEGATSVIGLIRHPEKPSIFTPANDPDRNMWFSRDVASMLGSARCAGACPPYYIDAEAIPANPGGWPRGGTTNLALPNRHLEYALTWYGLAATLIGVFLAFAAGRLKSARER